MLNVTITPESVFSVDLLFLRLSLAFAYLKTIKFEAANIRRAIHDFSVQTDLIKSASERIVNAALRTHKLAKFQHLVFPGLLDSVRIFELNPQTTVGIDLLMKVNLASIMVVKAFAGPLSPDKADFLEKLAKSTLNRLERLRGVFGQRFNETSDVIADFIALADIFYHCLLLFMTVKMNVYQRGNLAKRTKDFRLGHVENGLIARELPKLVAAAAALKPKTPDNFNIDENKVFIQAFFQTHVKPTIDE